MLLMLGKSPTSRDVETHRDHPNLGTLVTPSNGAVPNPEIPWACDNDAFGGFDEAAEKRYLAMLNRIRNIDGCMWVAAPDVVGNATETLIQFYRWYTDIAAWGKPIALVGQDGMQPDDVPWLEIDCLFIGGTTEWKLGWEAHRLAQEAIYHGKLVHMGRVNTWRRIQYAKAIGCDSFDGTKFARFTDMYLEKALELAGHNSQRMFDFDD